ncbi:MAG: hypothetical protein IKK61_04855 [Clostridia bacterium]|nr:hypothetical protein [Clostridia bacterium]
MPDSLCGSQHGLPPSSLPPQHIVLWGQRGVGKSTLARRLLEDWSGPVRGFITRASLPDADGFRSIYLHAADDPTPMEQTCNRIGRTNRTEHTMWPEVFDGLGVELLRAQPGSLILMDELGFLEQDAAGFRRQVLRCLDGNIPVLAVIKHKTHIPFLQEIRTHPRVQLYQVTEENRDDLLTELSPLIRNWNSTR